MWKLVSRKTGNPFYLVSEKEKYTVGRQNCDLNLLNDTSISRNHACLLPSEDYVKIIDVGSKYNTYCNENIENNIPLPKSTILKLKDGERVRFGIMGNEFILKKVEVITVSSSINENDKEILVKVMKKLKGRIETSITQNCTHLTMSEIVIREKLIYAVIEGIPIVSVQYWTDYLKAVQDGQDPPDPSNYIPVVTEKFVHIEKSLFAFKEERKSLFRDKVFYFMNKKTFDTYSHMVLKAGGQFRTLTKKISLEHLASKNVIVVQFSSNEQSQTLSQISDKITEFLKSKSLRLIPDYEIGLALIHCSTEKYCNTMFNIENDLCNTNIREKSTELNICKVIAEETPNFVIKNKKDQNQLTEIEIPESVVSTVYDLTESGSEKSVMVESENNAQISKEIFFNNLVEKPAKLSKSKENNDEKIDVIDDILTKRKRENLSTNNTFQCKKLHLNEEESSKISPANTTSIKTPIAGFLDKTSILNTTTRIASPKKDLNKTVTKNLIIQKKRRRFAKLDSDEEDEELFDFGLSNNKKKKTVTYDSEEEPAKDNSEDANLFEFKKSNLQQVPIGAKTNVEGQKTQNMNVYSVLEKTRSNYTKLRDVSNKLHISFSSIAWLSKNIIKCKIKDEIDNESVLAESKVSQNKTIKTEIKSEIDQKWIDSIKHAFVVRVRPMNLISKQPTLGKSALDSTIGNCLNSSNGKNFKAFVKKQNYKSQKRVVSTVPFHVTGFAF